MPSEKRLNKRYPDESTVVLGASRDIKGQLVDLSVAGLRARFDGGDAFDSERDYPIRINPCKAPALRPFSLTVRVVWSERAREGIEAGFRIVASPQGGEFQHYLDFLSYRNGFQNHAD